MANEKSRYTLVLDELATKRIERLQSAYGLRTRADVFDLATNLLYWYEVQQEAGYKIGRADQNGKFDELLLPQTNSLVLPQSNTNTPATI